MPSTPHALRDSVSQEGVPSALAAARDEIDALLRDRGLRRTTPELTAESLLRGAAASAALEGSPTELEALRRGAVDGLPLRAARLNAGLPALVPVVTRAPLQAIAQMHALAAAGAVDDAEVGRPRRSVGVADRLQLLARFLLDSADLPGVAVAALAHAEIAAASPFTSGNGLVARATERLLLVARGVDPTSMTVPEAGHLGSGEDYWTALAAYAQGTAEGRRDWLLYAARALRIAAGASPLSDHM